MNLNLLIPRIKPKLVDRRLNGTRRLIPTTGNKLDENSLLFVYKRLNGEYSISPHDINRKPYALVCDTAYAEEVRDIPLIITAEPRAAYAHACYLYNEIDDNVMKLVAVTGTNGKTTTAELLASIFRYNGIPYGEIGTGKIKIGDSLLSDTDYSMTTPDPELLYSSLGKMQRAACKYVVMEATSHAMTLGKLAPLTFERGIFTNLSHDHLDFHGNTEEYYKAKLSLFDRCRGGIFNVDDEFAERAYNDAPHIKTSVGIISKADAYATDISTDGSLGSIFNYRERGLITRVELRLPGVFNIYNALLAMRCAIELGLTPKEAKDGIAALDKVDGRMEKVHTDPTVIIDFAHTPHAMENALKSLKRRKSSGQKLITVFGCGGERDKEKRPIMARIAEIHSDFVVLTSDNSRSEPTEEILWETERGFYNSNSFTVIPDRCRAIEYALGMAAKNDIVAILGKGHERYIIDSEGKHPFNEREIISSFYTRVGGDSNENTTLHSD